MSYINAITSPAPAIVTYADATGNLQLQTAGTTAMTIDTSQNVGIGTTSPSATFEVQSNANLANAADAQIRAVAGSSSLYGAGIKIDSLKFKCVD